MNRNLMLSVVFLGLTLGSARGGENRMQVVVEDLEKQVEEALLLEYQSVAQARVQGFLDVLVEERALTERERSRLRVAGKLAARSFGKTAEEHLRTWVQLRPMLEHCWFRIGESEVGERPEREPGPGEIVREQVVFQVRLEEKGTIVKWEHPQMSSSTWVPGGFKVLLEQEALERELARTFGADALDELELETRRKIADRQREKLLAIARAHLEVLLLKRSLRCDLDVSQLERLRARLHRDLEPALGALDGEERDLFLAVERCVLDLSTEILNAVLTERQRTLWFHASL